MKNSFGTKVMGTLLRLELKTDDMLIKFFNYFIFYFKIFQLKCFDKNRYSFLKESAIHIEKIQRSIVWTKKCWNNFFFLLKHFCVFFNKKYWKIKNKILKKISKHIYLRKHFDIKCQRIFWWLNYFPLLSPQKFYKIWSNKQIICLNNATANWWWL